GKLLLAVLSFVVVIPVAQGKPVRGGDESHPRFVAGKALLTLQPAGGPQGKHTNSSPRPVSREHTADAPALGVAGRGGYGHDYRNHCQGGSPHLSAASRNPAWQTQRSTFCKRYRVPRA